MKSKRTILFMGLILTIFLILIGFYCFNLNEIRKEISEKSVTNIIVEGNEIDFDSLTLKQKIAQMIIVRGDKKDLGFNNLNIGGIFLDKQKTEEDYKNLIKDYQEDSKLELFVSTDLEGAWTPFHEEKPHQIFPHFSEIKTIEEAGEVGLKHGELLKEIGFNLNFAPVAEFSDSAYGGRVFSGSKEEIINKIQAYILGLQKNVLGTCKHYPGNSMEKNLHYVSDKQIISVEDLELFNICLNNNISSMMVGHHIVEGELDSNGKPSSVSKEIISTIDSSILIISDEINMRALKNSYPKKIRMYVDLINSGENIILDFDLNSVQLYKLIKEIEGEVERGNIGEEMINKSVRKILIAKGYKLK